MFHIEQVECVMSFQSPVVAANKAVTNELDQDEEVRCCSLMLMGGHVFCTCCSIEEFTLCS